MNIILILCTALVLTLFSHKLVACSDDGKLTIRFHTEGTLTTWTDNDLIQQLKQGRIHIELQKDKYSDIIKKLSKFNNRQASEILKLFEDNLSHGLRGVFGIEDITLFDFSVIQFLNKYPNMESKLAIAIQQFPMFNFTKKISTKNLLKMMRILGNYPANKIDEIAKNGQNLFGHITDGGEQLKIIKMLSRYNEGEVKIISDTLLENQKSGLIDLLYSHMALFEFTLIQISEKIKSPSQQLIMRIKRSKDIYFTDHMIPSARIQVLKELIDANLDIIDLFAPLLLSNEAHESGQIRAKVIRSINNYINDEKRNEDEFTQYFMSMIIFSQVELSEVDNKFYSFLISLDFAPQDKMTPVMKCLEKYKNLDYIQLATILRNGSVLLKNGYEDRLSSQPTKQYLKSSMKDLDELLMFVTSFTSSQINVILQNMDIYLGSSVSRRLIIENLSPMDCEKIQAIANLIRKYKLHITHDDERINYIISRLSRTDISVIENIRQRNSSVNYYMICASDRKSQVSSFTSNMYYHTFKETLMKIRELSERQIVSIKAKQFFYNAFTQTPFIEITVLCICFAYYYNTIYKYKP